MIKKVLFCSENSRALSGFGTYYREVLSRIYDNPNLEVAEFATGATVYDNIPHVKWKFYPNNVVPTDPRNKDFESNQQNKFGAWRFDKVLLDFKPDIVCSIKDPWMFQHECESHLRPFYHQVLMPTVDSVPQQELWINMFRQADSIFTYSDWAIPELEKACPKIKVINSAYSGVDLDVFKPRNKQEIRQKFGLPADAHIIGMVSRNQIRKLYPNLFRMFRQYLDKYGHTEIGKKTYLLCHTTYPDNGWEIADLLRDYGISNRVIFSYICKSTKKPFFSFFEGARTYSNASDNITGVFPNASDGYDYDTMSQLYNMLDMYIQYAVCEGLGMAQCEAAACGVPIASTDYSAMSDVVNKTNGFAIPPESMFLDFHIRAWRAIPSDEATMEIIFKYLSRNDDYKQTKSKQARKCAETYFNWDTTAKIWSNHLQSIELVDLQGQWDAPIRCQPPNLFEKDEKISNSHFVYSAIMTITGEPELFYNKIGNGFTNQLNLGIITKDHVIGQLTGYQRHKYQLERIRCGLDGFLPEDFIEFAHSFGEQ
jgi:glycosyltransferase involved in cell wall biosynthesis